MKKRQEEIEEGAADWVVSYGDMMSLLLTFFILLFSFSSIDAKKWQELVASLRGDPMVVELDSSDNTSVIDILPDESDNDPPSDEPGEKDDESPGEATRAPTGRPGVDEQAAIFDEAVRTDPLHHPGGRRGVPPGSAPDRNRNHPAFLQ